MFPRKIRDDVVFVAEGMLEAESVKLLLESFGITAYLNQESAGTAYGLTVGILGQVDVIVPPAQLVDAKQIIAEMEAGKLEANNDDIDS
ncbi:MAG: hypothetical protein CVU42_02330 [Chloroflexi bacterium HGW-Chloroflexi-4]|jgi:hypothetical protein|nr:MAG: hypothetical protein CVU42_02330 [Chloroflexi bacterium HGW-Chloroflexi-4]